MNLKDFSIEVEAILVDEELMRLLHYSPKNGMDDPLDSSKPNILDKPSEEKWDIIRHHIVPAIKLDDLEEEKKCKVFYYAGRGNPTNSNYLFSNQEYIFEVLVPYDFQIIDKRLEMICDRINDLVFNKPIGGLGNVLFRGRTPISVTKDYLGFRLVYEYVSENY
ncbi:hypothetical protein EVU96_09340 [Bacillus infantis]|uniref:hypothetical protein n=1 Tax=Bacillus infantis TaxID=324767 RepID=UPI00101D71AB|nr:hypothetical protein [Bacillus infantis]RYI30609.1 hypothetical protein EVU96_09340 [Bacillus infantis]